MNWLTGALFLGPLLAGGLWKYIQAHKAIRDEPVGEREYTDDDFDLVRELMADPNLLPIERESLERSFVESGLDWAARDAEIIAEKTADAKIRMARAAAAKVAENERIERLRRYVEEAPNRTKSMFVDEDAIERAAAQTYYRSLGGISFSAPAAVPWSGVHINEHPPLGTNEEGR